MPTLREWTGPRIASPAYARAWGKLKAGIDPCSFPEDEQQALQEAENWVGRRIYSFDHLPPPVTEVFCEGVYAAAMHAGLRGVEAILNPRRVALDLTKDDVKPVASPAPTQEHQ